MKLWSPWSRCSRTCGSEGLQTRRRVCLESRGCDGSSQAWRSCVLSPCPQSDLGLRDEQCAAFNNVPGEEGGGQLWLGAEQPGSPCSLDCQARDDPALVQRFNNKAVDGTRCGQTGLNVCLEGQCEVSIALQWSSGSCIFGIVEVAEYYSYSILVKNRSIETYYSSIGSSTVVLM